MTDPTLTEPAPSPGWAVFEWRDPSQVMSDGMPKQLVVALQHDDGTVHMAVSNIVSTASALMDRDGARKLRDWLNGIDLGDEALTREEHLTALGEFLAEYEREFGPIGPKEIEAARAQWPDVEDHPLERRARAGGIPQHVKDDLAQEEPLARRLPRSLGMGKDGPADLSTREDFGDG